MSEPIDPNDDSEIEALLPSFRRKARAITGGFGIPAEDGDDLVQDALMTYVVKRHRIYSLEAWLAITLKSMCINYWRRRQRSLFVQVDEAILELLAPAGDVPQETAFLRRDLDRNLAKLSPRCREVLGMRYSEERSPYEVASSLGYQHSGIHKVLHRCLAHLSQCLVLDGFQEAKS